MLSFSNRLYFVRLVSFRLLCEWSRAHIYSLYSLPPTPPPPHTTQSLSLSRSDLSRFFLLLSSEAVIKVSLSCFVFIKLHVVSACPFTLSLAYRCGYTAYLFSLFSQFFSFRFFCACAFFLSSHLSYFYYVCLIVFFFNLFIFTLLDGLKKTKKIVAEKEYQQQYTHSCTDRYGWMDGKEKQTIHSIRIHIAIWHLLLLYM